MNGQVIKLLFFLILSAYSSASYVEASPYLTSKNDSTRTSFLTEEDLTYIVKYAFLNLGEVRLKIIRQADSEKTGIIKTMSFIDSYEGLPFVDLHQIYESFIDSLLFPTVFVGIMMEDDTNYVKYNFEGDSVINIIKGDYNSNKIWFDSTAVVDKKFQDGLSVLYYARKHLGQDTTLIIPTFVNEKQESTTITFYREGEPVEIESVDYEIDCLKLDGETSFISVFGLTGYFEGWFSNDELRIPIMAKMQVIIGNVTLELIKWDKETWNPPICTN